MKRHPAARALQILVEGGELKLDGERTFVMQDGRLWFKAKRITDFGSARKKEEEVLLDPEMPFNTFVALALKLPEEVLWTSGAEAALMELSRKDRHGRCVICNETLVASDVVDCPATVVNGIRQMNLKGCGMTHDGVACRRCGVSWPMSSCSLWKKP